MKPETKCVVTHLLSFTHNGLYSSKLVCDRGAIKSISEVLADISADGQ